MQQLLVESAVLSLIGGLLGFGLAVGATTALGHVVAAKLPIAFNFAPDLRVLIFTLVLCVGTAAAFGLVPALRATRSVIRRTATGRGSRRFPST